MNPNVNKKILKLSGIIALVFLASALILGICELAVAGIKGSFDFLKSGERWAPDGEPYAVISLYTEESAALSADQVESWAHSIDSALLQSSIAPSSENARSWAYTYAAEKTMSVSGPAGSGTAEVIAAGGDFFVFHPLDFIYGSAFLNDTSNPNGVVIDDMLAWKIFGAVNIVGMEMTIDENIYTVVGVTTRESEHGIYNYTYGDRPRMYMSYAGYTKLQSSDGSTADITLFETVLPNEVKSFAKNIFDGVVTANEETMTEIESTDRFSLINRYNNMKILKYSWIRENKIEYPYWENEERVADYRCAILMIFEVAFAAVTVVSMLTSFILLRISGYTFTDTVRGVYEKISKKLETERKNRPYRKPKKKRRKKATINNNNGGNDIV